MSHFILVHAPLGAPGSLAEQGVPVGGTQNVAGTHAAMLVQIGGTTDDGALITTLIGDTGLTDVSPPNALRTQSFLFGKDSAGNFNPAGLLNSEGGDVDIARPLLGAVTRGQAWNPDAGSFDLIQIASSLAMGSATAQGALQAAQPGEWAVEHRPAVSVQATITRAAGGAGVRHVCRSITASLVGVVAQTILDVLLRDGASGAGPVLWSARVTAPAGGLVNLCLTGLSIVGSSNTDMTLEFSGAPTATNFQGVAMSGFDALPAAV